MMTNEGVRVALSQTFFELRVEINCYSISYVAQKSETKQRCLPLFPKLHKKYLCVNITPRASHEFLACIVINFTNFLHSNSTFQDHKNAQGVGILWKLSQQMKDFQQLSCSRFWHNLTVSQEFSESV